MIHKSVSYDLAMAEWANLLDTASLSEDQRAIAKAHLAGLKAEKELAYYLNVRLGEHRDLMVFNNLEIQHRDLTAQIDHLVLSRWSAYFIETKSVSHKININADGQWARVYGRKYKNIESPVEQSRRHEQLLFDLLESRLPEFMGRILGMQKTFRKLIDIQHIVAVSVGTLIEGRGKSKIDAHLKPLDQIPGILLKNHEEVRAGFLGTVFAEMKDKKTKRRLPAFSEEDFASCCNLLLQCDVSQTPLEQVHAYIDGLPREAAFLKENSGVHTPIVRPQASQPPPDPQPTEPICPACGGTMELKTARRGERAGKKFYSCKRYPGCKGIINIG